MRYNPTPSHEDALGQIFDDLKKHIPEDRTPNPIAPQPSNVSKSEIPEPEILSQHSPEEIRLQLEQKTSEILNSSKEDRLQKYDKFRERYGRPIFMSWYVSTSIPDNIIFGYKVKEKIGGGAFGDVYRATTGDLDNNYAIKILKHENSNDAEFWRSFRRGVESMRILSQHRVAGMVPYIEAHELPPCVIMKYIDGIDLSNLIKDSNFEIWAQGLPISIDVCEIIHNGHLLPERVLHRDIRPGNILIEDYYNPSVEGFSVKVLDFDLSWHKNAEGRSMLPGFSAAGFLAPEQLTENPKVSTRSALVDSYGIGMTIFFIFSRSQPPTFGSASEDWLEILYRNLSVDFSLPWVSAPLRIARLIDSCTKQRQKGRLDMGAVLSELKCLRVALSDMTQVNSAELWVDEIASRIFGTSSYRWNSDRIAAEFETARGLAIHLTGDEVGGYIFVRIERLSTGEEEFRSISKYWPQAARRASDALTKTGWKLDKHAGFSDQSIRVTGYIELDYIKDKIDEVVRGLRAAREEVML